MGKEHKHFSKTKYKWPTDAWEHVQDHQPSGKYKGKPQRSFVCYKIEWLSNKNEDKKKEITGGSDDMEENHLKALLVVM